MVLLHTIPAYSILKCKATALGPGGHRLCSSHRQAQKQSLHLWGRLGESLMHGVGQDVKQNMY